MIKIIDYKAGNAPSVIHAVSHLGYDAQFARTPCELAGATHIILPGVGSAKATMESLAENGLAAALEEFVLRKKIPFLGICVGLQILFEHSEEEETQCLGWLAGRVVKFDAAKVRVPQMGWNHVTFVKDALAREHGCQVDDRQNRQQDDQQNHKLDDYFYFVNSYHAVLDDPSDLWGFANYNDKFTAAVNRDNIFGTQFHAEKSGAAGLSLLKKFIDSQR